MDTTYVILVVSVSILSVTNQPTSADFIDSRLNLHLNPKHLVNHTLGTETRALWNSNACYFSISERSHHMRVRYLGAFPPYRTSNLLRVNNTITWSIIFALTVTILHSLIPLQQMKCKTLKVKSFVFERRCHRNPLVHSIYSWLM